MDIFIAGCVFIGLSFFIRKMATFD